MEVGHINDNSTLDTGHGRGSNRHVGKDREPGNIHYNSTLDTGHGLYVNHVTRALVQHELAQVARMTNAVDDPPDIDDMLDFSDLFDADIDEWQPAVFSIEMYWSDSEITDTRPRISCQQICDRGDTCVIGTSGEGGGFCFGGRGGRRGTVLFVGTLLTNLMAGDVAQYRMPINCDNQYQMGLRA